MKRRLATMLMLMVVPLGAASCVSSKKPKPDPSAKLEKYIVAEAPASIKKLGSDFDGKITLLGYELKNKGAVKVGDKVTYSLYWKVNQELGEDGWKLYTHILNDKNKKLLNIDGVGPLRDYAKNKNQALPPSAWKAGKVNVDEQTFTVPKSAAGTKLKIVTGIWKGNSRMKIKAGPNSGEDRALVATLPVAGKPKAENKVTELRVNRLADGQKIKIDGKLDEEGWKAAASSGAFVNVKTGKADPALAVQGSAKLTWDKDNFYVGFEVQDKDLIGGFEKNAKDPQLWTKDTVEIMVDPDGDGDNKDYYEIQVNPQNLVFDSQFDDYNKPNGGPTGPFGKQEWSAKLQSAVSLDGTLDKTGDEDKGYVVEIKLPWKSFDKAKTTPPELGQTWRLNLYAMQDNGGVAWSPILGEGNFHKASRFGRILWAEEGWEAPKPAASGSAAIRDAALKMGQSPSGTPSASAAPSASGAPRSAAPKPSAAKPVVPKPPAAPVAPAPPKPPAP